MPQKMHMVGVHELLGFCKLNLKFKRAITKCVPEHGTWTEEGFSYSDLH